MEKRDALWLLDHPEPELIALLYDEMPAAIDADLRDEYAARLFLATLARHLRNRLPAEPHSGVT